PATFEPWLRSVLDQAAGRTERPDAVQLSTIHRVKGREWPHVVVLHVSDGVLPHRLATDREEERRIFHVAVRRGQESVVVIGAADDPSPFLDELEGRRVTTGPAPVAAHVGLEFDEGGYTMEVLELTDDG